MTDPLDGLARLNELCAKPETAQRIRALAALTASKLTPEHRAAVAACDRANGEASTLFGFYTSQLRASGVTAETLHLVLDALFTFPLKVKP